jgi:hypothetical protein
VERTRALCRACSRQFTKHERWTPPDEHLKTLTSFQNDCGRASRGNVGAGAMDAQQRTRDDL